MWSWEVLRGTPTVANRCLNTESIVVVFSMFRRLLGWSLRIAGLVAAEFPIWRICVIVVRSCGERSALIDSDASLKVTGKVEDRTTDCREGVFRIIRRIEPRARSTDACADFNSPSAIQDRIHFNRSCIALS